MFDDPPALLDRKESFDREVWASVVSVDRAAKPGIWTVTCSKSARESIPGSDEWAAAEVFKSKLALYALKGLGILTADSILLIEQAELRRLIKALSKAIINWEMADFPDDMKEFVEHSGEISRALRRAHGEVRKE